VRVIHQGYSIGYEESDTRVKNDAVDIITNSDPDAMIVTFGYTDSLGHSFGTLSDETKAGIETADANIGEIIAAIQTRSTFAQEDWLIQIGTDHGRTDAGGHGGTSADEQWIFFIASGTGSDQGSTIANATNVDHAANALQHMLGAIDPAWDLDGSPKGLAPTAPKWVTPAFRRRHAVTGTAYTGKISAYTETSGHTFSKAAGPAWLSISATGVLSGTPSAGDTGQNTFTVLANNRGTTNEATMTIEVFAPGTEIVRELKVMSYNAWHGWGQINNGHDKGLQSIIRSNADIIGMQESSDNVSGSGIYQPQKVANDLGWYYRSNISGSLGLISRYPITDQTLSAGIARGIKLELTTSPTQEVILMTCHLDYQQYGPYAAQQPGATAATVLVEENASQRNEQIGLIMSAMADLLSNADNIPVLLTGDFNAPSHFDWTAATASSHNGVGSVAWPTSSAIINAGMKDSFRELHSDPATLPGNTWSPVFKGNEPQDRIDFVYFKGSAINPVTSQVFTTAVEGSVGAWGSSITPLLDNTWPSDHAAVLTTFRLSVVDRDGDNLSDAYENKHFGNLISQNSQGDADGDGASNFLEMLLGSSPVSPTNNPEQTLTIPASPVGAVDVSFQLSTIALEHGLVCESSENLTGWTPVWSYKDDPQLSSAIIQATPSSQGIWNVTLTDATASSDTKPLLFYRLRLGE
jgi:endonuclease/exonuclease/phosphatase family metal-dependent hydrolase